MAKMVPCCFDDIDCASREGNQSITASLYGMNGAAISTLSITVLSRSVFGGGVCALLRKFLNFRNSSTLARLAGLWIVQKLHVIGHHCLRGILYLLQQLPVLALGQTRDDAVEVDMIDLRQAENVCQVLLE